MTLPQAYSESVGRVIATPERPATTHQFYFQISANSSIGVGDIVKVVGEGQICYGLVTEGMRLAATEVPGGELIYTVQVLRRLPPEPIQPVPPGMVFLAGGEEVVEALGMEGYRDLGAIPIGVHASGGGGSEAAVLLDPAFLLGPEAAHVSITGVSGLATKTSAALWLLAALVERLPASNGRMAVVCFNVKGSDLCFIDQPAKLSESDLELYRRLELTPRSFQRFELYAPFRPDGVNLNTLRTNPALAGATRPLVWGLGEVLDFAAVLLNSDDADAKAGAFLEFLAERVVNRTFHDAELRAAPFEVRTFAELEEFFRAIFGYFETRSRAELWRNHHIATIRKIRNRLGNFSLRSQGLVTEDGTVSDLPWGRFEDRGVYVVDVAGLDPLVQDLVFARVVNRLRDCLERRELGVEQVVVFVDELNKYAPADGADTAVRSMLLDIAERGRYLGLSLVSAQQFRSQVHKRVVGNAGTSIFGRMDPDELATAGYQTLGLALKARLASLPKGQLMIKHPHFVQPVFVKFPRPAVLSGREGVEQFPPMPVMPISAAVAARLQGLDPTITEDRVARAIAGHEAVTVRRALHLVLRDRPAGTWAYFIACLGQAIPATAPQARVAVRGVADLVDPYG